MITKLWAYSIRGVLIEGKRHANNTMHKMFLTQEAVWGATERPETGGEHTEVTRTKFNQEY